MKRMKITLRRFQIMNETKVSQQINDVVGDNVKKLAQLFPSAVKDGEVDFEALKEELGSFTEVGAEKYELTWAGKADAKRIAREDIVGKTLKYIPEDSKDADTTENLYIEGENLEVLKLLRQNYYGSIKILYIDPPYNTGNDFLYNDNFDISLHESEYAEGSVDFEGKRYVKNLKSTNRFHARWISNMYERIKVARDLLSEDGVIFTSIGQDEVNNLISVMEEVFGEQNRVGICSRVMKTGGNKGQFFSPNVEYVLVFAKNINELGYFREALDDALVTNVYNLTESEGKRAGERYRIMGLCQPGLGTRPNQRYWIQCPDGTYAIPAGRTFPQVISEGEKVLPTDGDNCWKWIYDRYKAEVENNNIVFKQTNTSSLVDENGNQSKWNIYNKIWLKDRMEDGRVPVDLITKYENRHSSQELKDLDIPFDFAKPSDLIGYLISLVDNNKECIVMDFFSGSASTAHAVMKLNSEDGGKRKFIMVQIAEDTEESDAKKKGFDTICEIGKERIRRAGEKIKSEHPDSDLDVGFKVFRVADTNIKWNSLMDMGQIDLKQMETSPDTIDFMPNAKDVDVVYELMLRQRNIPLSLKIEQIFGGGIRVLTFMRIVTWFALKQRLQRN